LRQPVKRGPTNQQMSVRVRGANSPTRILVSNEKSSKSKANLSARYARSTSLIGSRTTPLSKRTQTSQPETLITEPTAPAEMLTGGSSAVFNRTWWPTSKPFPTNGHSIEAWDATLRRIAAGLQRPRAGEEAAAIGRRLSLPGNPSAVLRASWSDV
jgi:hypothetical protein